VVLFPPDVATPGPQIAPILEAVAAKLRDRPHVRIEIAGHCNDQEMTEVAYARANLVASGLAARGVPRTRVHVESYGNLRPIAPNSTEEGRAKNRRVDFRIVKEGAE
jgi:outer membrane protein OmpA-like peptidoglycan-associated protein